MNRNDETREAYLLGYSDALEASTHVYWFLNRTNREVVAEGFHEASVAAWLNREPL